MKGTEVPLSMRQLIPERIRICETSLVSLTVIIDRAIFWLGLKRRSNGALLNDVLQATRRRLGLSDEYTF